jgi:cell division protein FtsB
MLAKTKTITGIDAINATAWIAAICAALVILAAGILGYTALRDLFVSIGLFANWLGFLFPLLFDLAEVTAAVSVLNAKLQGEEDRFAWWMVLLFTFLGIVANVAHAAHAWTTGRIDTSQMVLAVFATSLFPLSVALVTHLLKRVIERNLNRQQTLATVADLNAEREQLSAEVNALTTKAQALRSELAAMRTQKRPELASSLGKLDEANATRAVQKQAAMDALLDYLTVNPTASLAEVGQAIGRSKTTVGNYVNELTETGQLRRNGQGWEVVQ